MSCQRTAAMRALAAVPMVLLLCGAGAATTHPIADRIPGTWDVAEITQTAMRELEGIPLRPMVRARILAWQIEEDKRPLRVEECIVAIEYTLPNGAPRWGVAHLCRNPKNKDPVWYPASICDAPFQQLKRFDHAPRNKELYEFLEATWWHFKADDFFELLDADVCRQAWVEFTGEGPTKFYPDRRLAVAE